MADYLAAIVARSTGATLPVRPRVPALFEPVGFAVVDGVAGPEQAIRDVAPRSDEPREPVSPPEPTTRETRDDGRRAPERVIPPAATVRALAEPIDVVTRNEGPPAPVPPAATAPAAPSQPSVAPLGSNVPEQPSARAREDVPAVPRTRASRRAAEPTVATNPLDGLERRLRSIAEEVLGPDRLSAPPALAPQSRQSPPAAKDAPLRPRPAPAPETAAAVRPARRPEPSSGETLVHVSIGRVDVRAPAPTEPAQPARARVRRPPPTRLDEYLGRRNGTRR